MPELLLVLLTGTRPTLDDVFLSLTGRTLRESADAAAPTTTHDGA